MGPPRDVLLGLRGWQRGSPGPLWAFSVPGPPGGTSPWDKETPVLGRLCGHLPGALFLSTGPCVGGVGGPLTVVRASSEHVEGRAQVHFPTLLLRVCTEAPGARKDRPREVCAVRPHHLGAGHRAALGGSGCASERPPSVLFVKADTGNTPPSAKEVPPALTADSLLIIPRRFCAAARDGRVLLAPQCSWATWSPERQSHLPKVAQQGSAGPDFGPRSGHPGSEGHSSSQVEGEGHWASGVRLPSSL